MTHVHFRSILNQKEGINIAIIKACNGPLTVQCSTDTTTKRSSTPFAVFGTRDVVEVAFGIGTSFMIDGSAANCRGHDHVILGSFDNR